MKLATTRQLTMLRGMLPVWNAGSRTTITSMDRGARRITMQNVLSIQ